MPVSIPFGELKFHVVSDPYHSLRKPEQQRILRDLIPVTQRAFGRPTPPKASEIREHAFGKGVSTVVLVEKAGRYIGYYSTAFHRLSLPDSSGQKAPAKTAVYLAGSVLDPLEKKKNLFTALQMLAIILEGDKQRLLDFIRLKKNQAPLVAGGIDYVVARTQSGRVAASLRNHRLWPFNPDPLLPGHPSDFSAFLGAISEKLSPGKAFDPEHFITRKAYGGRLYGPDIDLVGKDAHVAPLMRKLNHDAGDAMWGIGFYPASAGRYTLAQPASALAISPGPMS